MAYSIGIVGAGTMGAGIAHVAALQGSNVYLYDTSEELIRRGIAKITYELKKSVDRSKLSLEAMDSALKKIRAKTSMSNLDSCDIIIEAVTEDLRVKKDLFKKLDTIAHHTTILATNTSSFSITSIAGVTSKPQRVVGMHFFNPVHLMPLVEIIEGAKTSDETILKTIKIAEALGKKTVRVKDTPGFIVNRIARPFYGEALKILGEGVANVEEIDKILREEGNFKMGPFELMDLIGIDVNYAVTQSIYEQFFHDPRYRPHPIQKMKVDSGELGKKTKKGFYNYPDEIK